MVFLPIRFYMPTDAKDVWIFLTWLAHDGEDVVGVVSVPAVLGEELDNGFLNRTFSITTFPSFFVFFVEKNYLVAQ